MKTAAWGALCLAGALLAACTESASAPAPGRTASPEELRAAADRADRASAALKLEACADKWLRDRGLNDYGDAPGTSYAGGTPLFDEKTGKRTSRTDYVFERHAEARSACTGGDGG